MIWKDRIPGCGSAVFCLSDTVPHTKSPETCLKSYTAFNLVDLYVQRGKYFAFGIAVVRK